MALINNTLANGSVVVAINHCYDDNNGSWDEAVVWNGESTETVVYNGPYNSTTGDAEIDASRGQIDEAINYHRKQGDLGLRSRLPYVGCIVTLKRARKAPNRTPLKIVGYDEGGYNSRYNQKDPERIQVETEGGEVWVSVNCIDKVLLGKKPRWAN